jgi:magnesium-transporting ATPase (P-type)
MSNRDIPSPILLAGSKILYGEGKGIVLLVGVDSSLRKWPLIGA